MSSKQGRMVNIPRSVVDQYYRYKMPELEAKVESRGNGIKTVIVNIADIAKALARPATYPVRYIGYTLGALVDINETTNRYIVNGKHSEEDLSALLDGFIDKYVLCKHCGNPETILSVTKDQSTLRLKCKACGGVTKVDALDQLGKFIAKNPPPKMKDMMLEESKKKRSQEEEEEQVREVENAMSRSSLQDSDTTWSLDVSEEAIAARRKEAGSLAASMPRGALFELKANTKPLTPAAEKQLVKRVAGDLMKLYQRNAGKDVDSMVYTLSDYFKKVEGINAYILVNAFFAGAIVPEGENLLENSYQYAAHIAPFLTGKEFAQHALLDSLERARQRKMVTTKMMPTAIKQYYDVDALEEDFIISWYEEHAEEGGKAIKPFVDWLKTAEVAE